MALCVAAETVYVGRTRSQISYTPRHPRSLLYLAHHPLYLRCIAKAAPHPFRLADLLPVPLEIFGPHNRLLPPTIHATRSAAPDQSHALRRIQILASLCTTTTHTA